MFGFSHKDSQKEQTVLIIDIGSGSVGGAIAKITRNEAETTLGEGTLPTILKSNRVPIRVNKNLNLEKFLEDMETALGAVIQNLYQEKVGAPEKIFCVLSSPWYISETRLVKIEREKPFMFTKHMADEFLAKEIATVTLSYQKKYSGVESAPEVIENHIMKISLNGYPSLHPIGMESKSIEMNMVISLSPKLFLDRIRGQIKKTFTHTPVYFSSFSLLSYLAVRDRYVTANSYILLDVAGHVSDVSIVIKDVLKFSLSFPFGKYTFINHVSNALKVEKRDVDELYTLYRAGTLEESRKAQVSAAFAAAGASWSESFKESINALRHTFTLPDTVFMTADDDILPLFKDLVSKEEYLQSMVTERKWKVVTLEGQNFLNMCHISGGPCDAFLMIEAIAISRKIAHKKD